MHLDAPGFIVSAQFVICCELAIKTHVGGVSIGLSFSYLLADSSVEPK